MNVKSWFKKAPTLMVGLLVGALVACGGSSVASSGSSGLTQTEVQALISAAVTPLQSQIAVLQSQVNSLQASSGASKAAVFIRAPNAAQVMARQTRGMQSEPSITRALPSPCNWTLTGRPNTSNPISDNTYAGVSCTGYYFLITGAATGDVAGIQAPNTLVVQWDGPSCTGNAYVVQGVSAGARVNGFVFVTNFNNAVADPNASDYWYVAPATPLTNNVAAMSSFTPGMGCTSVSGTIVGWAALPNDESVTGIPSAPVPGPVLISN